MKLWQVKFTLEGEGDLRVIDEQFQNRIIKKIGWLESNFSKIIPEQLASEWKNFFKFRVGSWRIVYQVEFKNRLIIIHRIQPRDKVYKIR